MGERIFTDAHLCNWLLQLITTCTCANLSILCFQASPFFMLFYWLHKILYIRSYQYMPSSYYLPGIWIAEILSAIQVTTQILDKNSLLFKHHLNNNHSNMELQSTIWILDLFVIQILTEFQWRYGKPYTYEKKIQ